MLYKPQKKRRQMYINREITHNNNDYTIKFLYEFIPFSPFEIFWIHKINLGLNLPNVNYIFINSGTTMGLNFMQNYLLCLIFYF